MEDCSETKCPAPVNTQAARGATSRERYTLRNYSSGCYTCIVCACAAASTNLLILRAASLRSDFVGRASSTVFRRPFAPPSFTTLSLQCGVRGSSSLANVQLRATPVSEVCCRRQLESFADELPRPFRLGFDVLPSRRHIGKVFEMAIDGVYPLPDELQGSLWVLASVTYRGKASSFPDKTSRPLFDIVISLSDERSRSFVDIIIRIIFKHVQSLSDELQCFFARRVQV